MLVTASDSEFESYDSSSTSDLAVATKKCVRTQEQQATQEELTVLTRSSGLSCFVGFVGLVECHSNFVLRDGVFVVGLEGGLLTFRPVLLPDLFDVLGVAILRVDLPLDDEGTELVFVRIVPLFSALWWHRRIYEGLAVSRLIILIKPCNHYKGNDKQNDLSYLQ